MREVIPASVEAYATHAVDAAIMVHKALGPGLLESVYQTCLMYELRQRGLIVDCQVQLPIRYNSLVIDGALRLDLLVGHELVIEVKAVEKIVPIHKAQLLTYLKLADKRLGLLMNFNVIFMKDGIERLAL